MLECSDINNSEGVAQRFEISRTRAPTQKREPKDNELMLVVQGRLVWGNVIENNGIYISWS